MRPSVLHRWPGARSVNGTSAACAARARCRNDRSRTTPTDGFLRSGTGTHRARQRECDARALRAISIHFSGKWQVRHRSLKQRLAGSNDWEEFGGTSHWQSILGGIANFNESTVHRSGSTYQSLGLRAFDAKTNVWTDWSLSGRDPTKIVVDGVGGFANGVGIFLRRRHVRRQADPGARHVHAAHCALDAVGTGVLAGRRTHLGNQLRHAPHAHRRLTSPIRQAVKKCNEG